VYNHTTNIYGVLPVLDRENTFYPINALMISSFFFPPLLPTGMSTMFFSIVKEEKGERENAMSLMISCCCS